MQPSDLRHRLLEMGIEPKRSLGQNFLTNQHVIERIILTAQQLKKSLLIEIGPGPGSFRTRPSSTTPA